MSIISPTGVELKSAETIRKEQEEALEFQAKQEEQQRLAYEKFQADIVANRIEDLDERTDARLTIDTLLRVLSTKRDYVVTDLENRKDEKGNVVRVPIPSKSIPMGMLEAHGMMSTEAVLLKRIIELAYKL